jgi:dolichol-phosphate mannosyltransferase
MAGTQPAHKLLSIVVPVYNEAENIDALYAAVIAAMASETERYDLEFVFTDNHSTDATFTKIAELAARDGRIRCYRFSRNFGYQLSIQTGYTLARGDAAVQLDADLQDPPGLISDFLRLWEQGYQVVYGVRRARKEGRFITSLRRLFYWLVDTLSTDHLPRDAGDFRLIDRRIMDELKAVRDPNIYVRGRVSAMGFRQIGVVYDRAERRFGESKFKFGHMLSLAIDAITSHSVIPLRFATYLGALVTLGAFLLSTGYVATHYLVGTDWPPGFTTLTVLVILSIGINSLLLGVIGEYLARIFLQLKQPAGVIIEALIEPRQPELSKPSEAFNV